jgi:hypothetical protein
MDEKGKVISITDDKIEVALEPSKACATCPAGQFCRPTGSKRIIIAINPGDISVDDEVIVRMVARYSLMAIIVFFGLPVILSFIGLLIGQQWGELGSLLIGTGGFILGLVIAKVVNDILGSKRGFYPRITKVTEKTQS